jgi:hypothetical protein
MSEIQAFDPSKLMDGVRDRIKSEFVSLIPEDQWKLLIDKEINRFFNVAKEVGYNPRERTTDFQDLVQYELKKETQRRVTEYLSSPDFQVMYGDYGQPIASQKVKELMVDSSGLILQNMIGGMLSTMMQDYANQMRNRQF